LLKMNFDELFNSPIFPYERCVECRGLGYVDFGDICSNCKGTGLVKINDK